MNEFGHIADDLTSLEMRVERMLGRTHAKALQSALQRAFVEACKASRAQRLEDEGSPPSNGSGATENGRKTNSGRLTAQNKQPVIPARSAEVGA